MTAADIAAFHDREPLRTALRESHRRMLAFYGLLPADERLVAQWATPGNHNFLRITRVLRCLTLLGLAGDARAMLAQLREVHARHAAVIGARSRQFWEGAVKQP